MTTDSALALPLENAQALMRKISINVLNKDAEFTVFTLPFEGIALSREQLDHYLGDRTFESWFEKRKDGAWLPMPWVGRLPKGEISIDEEFEAAGAELIVSGKKTLVFEAPDPDEEDDEENPAPAIRVTNIVLTPQAGGMTLLALHLQVRPGLGNENLLLQEHQYRHVTLTLGDTKLLARKGRQQALPLGEGGVPPATEGTPASGNGDVAGPQGTEEFARGTERQLEEHRRKSSGAADGTGNRGGRRSNAARH